MFPRLAPRFLLLAALLLLVALPAGPAFAASKAPKITKVSPSRVKVGSKLTIRGKNFSSRRTRNTVFFRGAGGTSAFVKPSKASRTRLVVKVPRSVGKLLKRKSGKAQSTRIKIRVLTTKFSKYTSSRLSPVVTGTGVPDTGSPAPRQNGSTGGGGTGPGGSNAAATPCPAGDPDGDLLDTATEDAIHTQPCNADSDGDGVSDGFEYKSALDLNDDEDQSPNSSLPYPGKRPYANPLDGTDANTDYDGDGLTLMQEYILWNYTVTNGAPRTLNPLSYSDGEQYSVQTRDAGGHRVPTLAAAGYSKQTSFLNWASSHDYRTVDLFDDQPWAASRSRNNYGLLDFNRDGAESTVPPPGYRRAETTYYDLDQDGFLSDEERDEDGDGLTNFDESRSRATSGYWNACYNQEAPYPVVYNDTDFTDPDTDGDGVIDGADDQDHDDVPNVMELSRNAASGTDDTGNFSCEPAEGLPTFPDPNHADVYGRVNPFNPCLPDVNSRTCNHHPGFGSTWAPFDGSPNYYSLN